jgi:hypothetical protein
MTWGDRIGTVRYWQQLGDPYAQMAREALKPALGATAVAAYLGVTVWTAVLIGAATVVGLLIGSVVFGWLVWRHRVIHATIRKEWENNPVVMRQLELLEEIARNTNHPAFTVRHFERTRERVG